MTINVGIQVAGTIFSGSVVSLFIWKALVLLGALSGTDDIFPAFVNQSVPFKGNIFKYINKIKTFPSPPQQSLKHRNVFKTAFHPCVQTKT